MSELRTREVEDLLTAIAGIDDREKVYAFLQDLFTVREIRDISQRLDVARLLREKKSYSAIEESTGASATTIARVSKALNYGAGGYQAAFDALNGSSSDTE